jgi:hypothetical protein
MNNDSSGETIALTTVELLDVHLYPHGPLDMTATQIKNYLECMSGRTLSLSKVGAALTTLGFRPETIKARSVTKTVYSCGQK